MLLEEESIPYQYHYAYICSNSSSHYNISVYDAAYETAELNKDYLEFMGKNLSTTYSRNELMEIAIDAGVDGIIVQADESEEMTALITKADSISIPVVTIGTDNTIAPRQSYVGFGYYELGQKYGKQLLKMERDEVQNVLVLLTPDLEDSSQNIIMSGINDMVNKLDDGKHFNFTIEAIPNSSKFDAEESISSMIMHTQTLPDIIIALNETYTTCLCQALVDYNRVGESQIIGFYVNDTILSAIEKGILDSSVTINTPQLGTYCIEALNEYIENGYVNEYMPADIEVITSENVQYYENLDEG